ncbi:hypothetical protein BKA70DRAFT_641416, partial [Coprinopsis sp. MPI-PUGE-AT-0042]
MFPFSPPNLTKSLHLYLYAVSAMYRRGVRMRALRFRQEALKPSYIEGTLAGPFRRPVETYCWSDIYVASYESGDMRWEDMRRVTRVSLHKEPGKLGSEYVVLQCLFPGDDSPFYIKVQRIWEPGKVLTEEDSDDRSRLDTFHFVLEEDAAKGRLVQFEPREPLCILDAAVLACTVHTARPREQLVGRQCFWYGFMFYEILLKVFGAQRSEEHVVLVDSTTNKGGKNGRLQAKQKPRRCIASVANPSDLSNDLALFKEKFEADVAMARDEMKRRIKAGIEKRDMIENFHEKILEEKDRELRRLDERIEMTNRALEERDMRLKEIDREIQRSSSGEAPEVAPPERAKVE